MNEQALTAAMEQIAQTQTALNIVWTVVAAVLVMGGNYLLQLRDDKHGIFFPAHWGCFGGGAEVGETREEALVRELHEELAIVLEPANLRYFTHFEFDLSFAGLPLIWRYFYEVELAPSRLA